MSKEIIAFGKIEDGERKTDHRKNLTFSEDVDIDNILISGMVSLSKKNNKYFIGHKDVD